MLELYVGESGDRIFVGMRLVLVIILIPAQSGQSSGEAGHKEARNLHTMTDNAIYCQGVRPPLNSALLTSTYSLILLHIFLFIRTRSQATKLKSVHPPTIQVHYTFGLDFARIIKYYIIKFLL